MSTCLAGLCAPNGTPGTEPPPFSPPADSSPPPDTPAPPSSDSSPPPQPPSPDTSTTPSDPLTPPPPDTSTTPSDPLTPPPLPPTDVPPSIPAPPPSTIPPDFPLPPPADVPPFFPPPPPSDTSVTPSALPPADGSPSFPPPPPSDTPVTPPPSTTSPPTQSESSPTPSSQTPPPSPIYQQTTSKNSTESPPRAPLQSSAISVNSNPPSAGSPSGSIGVIAGVVFGGAAVLVILGLFFMVCGRKKRRNEKGAEGYYMAPPHGTDGINRGQMQYWQQSNPPSGEHYHMSNLPPPPGSFQSPSQRNSSLPPHSFTNGSGNFGPNYTASDNSNMPLSGGISNSKSSFTYEELAMATNGFSKANFLGQGGFGFVHKGILPNGKEVAIKSLKADSGQGDREFHAEIDVISRVHHKHLVSLVGYCITGTQRMLVYEFVQNNTLEFHLYGKGRPTMDWPSRLKIAVGAAKGLAYLHEDCHPKIIHRDIKGANILIDSQFEAKVADFGLAKFTEDANTHVSTRVMGTFGYLAPEYASSGKLTEKSDVFSFGVMLLELITGRPPVDRTNSYMEDSLVEWAGPLLSKAMEDGNFEPIVDPKLQKNYNRDEMACMIACAAGATSHSAKRRPKMSQIVGALESGSSMSGLSDVGESKGYGSSEYPSGQYKQDMKKFREMVLRSEDSGISDYTTTGDYSKVVK